MRSEETQEVTVVLECSEDQKIINLTVVNDFKMDDEDFCGVLRSLIDDVRKQNGKYLSEMTLADNLMN